MRRLRFGDTWGLMRVSPVSTGPTEAGGCPGNAPPRAALSLRYSPRMKASRSPRAAAQTPRSPPSRPPAIPHHRYVRGSVVFQHETDEERISPPWKKDVFMRRHNFARWSLCFSQRWRRGWTKCWDLGEGRGSGWPSPWKPVSFLSFFFILWQFSKYKATNQNELYLQIRSSNQSKYNKSNYPVTK